MNKFKLLSVFTVLLAFSTFKFHSDKVELRNTYQKDIAIYNYLYELKDAYLMLNATQSGAMCDCAIIEEIQKKSVRLQILYNTMITKLDLSQEVAISHKKTLQFFKDSAVLANKNKNEDLEEALSETWFDVSSTMIKTLKKHVNMN